MNTSLGREHQRPGMNRHVVVKAVRNLRFVPIGKYLPQRGRNVNILHIGTYLCPVPEGAKVAGRKLSQAQRGNSKALPPLQAPVENLLVCMTGRRCPSVPFQSFFRKRILPVIGHNHRVEPIAYINQNGRIHLICISKVNALFLAQRSLVVCCV